jgi:hypothetical protein
VRDVEALVALQADQAGARSLRERLRQLGLADPRLTLEQQRLLDGQREEERCRQPPMRQVGLGQQGVLDLADRLESHGDAA